MFVFLSAFSQGCTPKKNKSTDGIGLIALYSFLYSQPTGTAASFNIPLQITLDSSQSLYVADSNNSSILEITSSGVVTTYAGGSGTAAEFRGTGGIAVESAGVLYVSDWFSIRKIVQ